MFSDDEDLESADSGGESAQDLPGTQIGIDLGTSNSVVSYYKSGRCQFLEIANESLIPSVIFFKEMASSSWIYGRNALRRGILYPDAVCRHFKRHIGESEPQEFNCEPQGSAKKSVRTYVLDTNIFLEDPHIIEGIEEGTTIIIPKTVYEELSRRKSAPETEVAAEVALQSINEHRDRVQLEDSHLDLLPDDMFKSADKNNNDRNDSKILSVALFFDSPETVLISNDRGVLEKSTWLKRAPKFKVQNYTEFSFYRNATRFDASENKIKLTGREAAVIFLKYLHSEAEKKLGYVSKAVITVPQKFSPIQRNEIKQAGFDAGFSEVELYTEPVAAAVAYGIERDDNSTLLVYDFGGGTLDITVFKISDGEFYPLASDGNPKLGGEDFTQEIIKDFKEKLIDGELLAGGREMDMFDEQNSELTHEEFIKNELKIWEACEEIKCSLSSLTDTTKTIQLYVESGKPREAVDYTLTRSEFEEITAELLVKARKALDSVLNQAKLNRADIDTIILAGGTSKISSVKSSVEKYFGKPSYADRNPATLIAEGAALFADLKWNQNTTIDRKIKIFEKTVTDLGVALKGRKFDRIIQIGSALPCEHSKKYSLVEDYQQELNIECYTREPGSTASRTFDEGIDYIGQIHISNLPPLKISDTDVTVIFRITKEYELEVEVQLHDMTGAEIKQSTVKIDTVGV